MTPTSWSSGAASGTGRSSTPDDRALSLAAIGGGTGLAALLRGLKHHVGQELARLTAVVTVSDDGGSSGRLRRDFGVLPPGDIRNCIVALADDEDLLARLFQYRFASGEGLTGHSFGNLLITALTGITGDFYQAILTAEEILSVRGRILPATLTDVRLRAEGRSGRLYDGESAIGRSGEPLAHVELDPPGVRAFPPAVEALRSADLILLGPGSLYTSILPNLLIREIREAVRDRRGRAVLVMNLMTQPGETDGMAGLDHLAALEEHAGGGLVDAVLYNDAAVPSERLAPYRDAGSQPVRLDLDVLAARGIEVIGCDLLAPGELIRHDSDKLRRAVVSLALPGKPAGEPES